MRLCSTLAEVDQLTTACRAQMYALMQQCYDNLDREYFERDLDDKWLAILVHDPQSKELVGFSTQKMLHACFRGRSIHALYSGDTVMAPAHWGDKALPNAWGRLALRLIDEHCGHSLYWLLTSKGFRTYRYLPLFFRQFYPNYDAPAQNEHLEVVDLLAEAAVGEAYDPVRRVVTQQPHRYVTRPAVSTPGNRAERDPHIRYFLQQNPGYGRGEELCCLAPLSRQNFTRLAYRVISA